MSSFAYQRDESRSFGELRFPPADVLDTTELARRWAGWLDLRDTDGLVPLRSLHAVHLARMLTGEQDEDVPNWFSTVSVTSSRYQVVVQARSDRHRCEQPGALPAEVRSPRWQALVEALEGWAGLPAARRVVVVALLTQLGFHRLAVRLVGTFAVDADPVRQQLVYEVARAAYQLNRKSPIPYEIFAWLARDAVRPALRTLAALQLVSTRVRGSDREEAGRWLAAAERSLAGLGDEPDWLAHLVTSRYHRAAALHELSGRDREPVVTHMRAALEHDDALARSAGNPSQVHYQRENRGLVLEAHLKLDTLTGTASAPADAVEQLLSLDPVDPEPLYAVGAYLAGFGDREAALATFLRAAGSGTLRGASAANAAAVCAERLGRPDVAEHARRLLLDLDPAARLAVHQADTRTRR
ncbi:hypothetical protein GCM10009677_15020 [Sphaerisporangium rubeum]|uniref:Uncharacterized protein n=1 Tax=Sphaerisporangium rubeum TaxID=321317 RepID=A0A7X0M6N8_9ACTN|nr:hypothetical protein [Sphaerisporangium rubeum]MBB6472174.1 hypothetical protein [Sphaerisporangium rubeum]